jgi:hypothetical protein
MDMLAGTASAGRTLRPEGVAGAAARSGLALPGGGAALRFRLVMDAEK